MTEKYISVKHTNAVGKVVPETNNCWFNAGMVLARMSYGGHPVLLDLPNTEYITKLEYFKGRLSG